MLLNIMMDQVGHQLKQ